MTASFLISRTLKNPCASQYILDMVSSENPGSGWKFIPNTDNPSLVKESKSGTICIYKREKLSVEVISSTMDRELKARRYLPIGFVWVVLFLLEPSVTEQRDLSNDKIALIEMSEEEVAVYDLIHSFAILIFSQVTNMSTSKKIDTFNRLGHRFFSLISNRFLQSNMWSHYPTFDCDGAWSTLFC